MSSTVGCLFINTKGGSHHEPAASDLQLQRKYTCACVIRPSCRLRPHPVLGLTRVRVLDWSFQLRLRPSRHTSNRPRWCWRRKTTILAASMGPEDDLSSHMLHCPSTPSPAISCAWASGVAAGSHFGRGACPWGSSGPWLDIRATATFPLSLVFRLCHAGRRITAGPLDLPHAYRWRDWEMFSRLCRPRDGDALSERF